MTDNELIALLIGILRAAFTAQDLEVKVRQSYQPRQQGTPTPKTVLINKIFNKRFGYLSRNDEYDEDAQVMRHTEKQWMETTFQITALAIQNPTTPEEPTASDLVNNVAQILQTDATLAVLRASNVGIYRISDIRNPYFVDDKERFEASPSFDFITTHEQVYISEVPVLQSTEFQIIEV